MSSRFCSGSRRRRSPSASRAARGFGWQGQSAEVDWSGLLAIPKRYFVDLHHIVARDPYIAYTHMATAGGAIAALALVALNYGLALYWPSLDLGDSRRGARHVDRRRASSGCAGASRSPACRGARGTGCPIRSRPSPLGSRSWSRCRRQLSRPAIAAIALILLLVGSAELALGIGLGGPMKHAVAGLSASRLPSPPRALRGVRSTALKPLDLDARDFGVGKPADFRWNQLLGFDACVQCGKCERRARPSPQGSLSTRRS